MSETIKIQIVRNTYPKKGSSVKDTFPVLHYDTEANTAEFELVHRYTFSDKPKTFHISADCLFALVMKPESVKSWAKIGAFFTPAGYIPGGGLVNITAKLVAGGYTMARATKEGLAGLIMVYKNEKGFAATFNFLAPIEVVDFVISLLPKEKVDEEENAGNYNLDQF